ncbi:hypothetical protein [Nonomuraea sp. NPDC052265]|uniref:hypothetical protein n=1 Tax=Nonomuraea sp. NPDC052265 TaxID=3364374 RepID=UPI0037C623D1
MRRERTAVHLLFFLAGMAIGTWTARIPAIKESLGLDAGRLSLALLAIAAGAVAGMTTVGRLAPRRLIPATLAGGGVPEVSRTAASRA